jgi:hypothetical protein
MDYWTRFITWCRQPNMIKLRTFNPHVSMAGLFKGAKVGVASGVIHGALLGFVLNVVYNIIYGIQHNRLELLLESYITHGMPWGGILSYVLMGAIFGVIFGLMFVALYDRLPGTTPAGKGIVTSIIFWGATLLGVPSLYHLSQGGFEAVYWFLEGMGWQQAVTGMYLAIPSGWVMGRFWTSERFGQL